jgi:hypothetical protein
MIAAVLLLAAASADPIVGRWEGTSLCQVKPSPCHDEHAVYYMKAADPHGYTLDGYKLVSDEEQFMGAIDLTFDAKLNQLDGVIMDRAGSPTRLNLVLRGSHLSGSMIQADGTVYRLIEIDKR